MARPPITAKGELLFRQQLNAALDYVEALGGSGGVSDGDKGDITVSGAGAVWTIDSGAVDWTEVASKPATFAPSAHTHPTSDVTGLDTALSGKQATLVSGTNIKTVNGTTLLGSGDLVVSGGAGASPALAWVI